MIWYHLIFSDNKKAVGYAWNLMGFVAKLAQGVSMLALSLSQQSQNMFDSLDFVRNEYFRPCAVCSKRHQPRS